MKSTVTLNSRGVVTLPAKLREAMGLKADDVLIAETTSDGILLRPWRRSDRAAVLAAQPTATDLVRALIAGYGGDRPGGA